MSRPTTSTDPRVPSGNGAIVAGDYDTIIVGDDCHLVAGDFDTVTGGGGNFIQIGSNGIVTAGADNTIFAGDNNVITFAGGLLRAGDNNTITLAKGANLVITGLGKGDVINAGGLTSSGAAIAGAATITLDAHESVTINGTGDTIIGGQGDYITFGGHVGHFGGPAPTKISDTVGAHTTGITVDSGLGCDTIAGGVGYEGGNTYIGSYHDDIDGINGIGNCINYSNLGLTAADAGLCTTVDLDAGVARAYDAGGKLLWTDTLVNMQQAKAANGNGDVLIASNSYYSELKGAGGTTSYYCGDHGTTVFWGWNRDVAHDIAYGNANAADEYLWRISAGAPNGNDPGRPASVLGQLIYNFDVDPTGAFDLAKGDKLDFSSVNNAWGGLSNFANWSVQDDGHGGTNLVVQGIGTVVDLGNTSLSMSQLVQFHDSGHLVI